MKQNKKKICIVVGARPNFIKAFPVYKALESLNYFSLELVNTGQHYDKNMSNVFFNQLNMKEPDINLDVRGGMHGEQTGRLLKSLEQHFIEHRPDLVVVFGDVNSTLAAALAAVKMNIFVAHIESGLRSYDRKMPEEINRVLTDQISDLLFTTSPEAEIQLLQEGVSKDKIHFVGNTMIDSLVEFEFFFTNESMKSRYKLTKNNYILVTMHRPANVDCKEKLKDIVKMINIISKEVPCIWPLHPRLKDKIKNIPLSDNVFLTDPLGYLEFMGLQRESLAILTDSGGVQEESTFMGVRCFTVRDNTERPVTITEGTNILVGTDFSKVPSIVLSQLNKDQELSKDQQFSTPKYWDGAAAQRIVKVLKNFLILNSRKRQ
jgi:UDP-N-acetylglucosamine 2-epimerase (non-hydrolysing)